jgi:hypothetical protein
MIALAKMAAPREAVNRHPPFGLLYALIARNEFLARRPAQTRYHRRRGRKELASPDSDVMHDANGLYTYV